MATLEGRLASVLSQQCAPGEPWPPLDDTAPRDRAERFRVLLAIYDLTTAPLEHVGPAAQWATHPAVAGLKMRLEADWMAELDAAVTQLDVMAHESDPVRGMRTLAARERLPRVYRWIAQEASREEVLNFLAIEGGPDGGFDDLVALCQVGLSGQAKLELARNYWDEMGDGDLAGIHTELHREMAQALAITAPDRRELPVAALERAALGGLLATNRWLQPEMLGALGLTELQAGPRCRLVLTAIDRLGLPEAAKPFYQVHADVDPRHGKDWLEQAITPLAEQQPQWRGRMLRGAAWRWHVNAALFDALSPDRQSERAA